MINKEIKIPNIGDFKDVEIIEVLIKNGQSIKKNDPLITIESDKSSIEIPSPYDGSVKSLNVSESDDEVIIITSLPEPEIIVSFPAPPSMVSSPISP